MAYGKVSETYWHDEKIRTLSEDARHFMLYLMSCPHGNRLGLFVLDPLYAAADVIWTEERVRETLQELADAERIRWDPDNRTVFVRNYLKHNTLLNKSVVMGALNDLAAVPDTPLIEELGEVVRADLEGETGPARLHYAGLMERIMQRIMSQKRKTRVVEPQTHNEPHNDGHNAVQNIQGTGSSKPTPVSTLESNDREGLGPEDHPSDCLSSMLEDHPDAGEVLNGLTHPGGPEATAATLRQRFLYPDGQGIPDECVKGLELDARQRAVAAALSEYRDQGEEKWNTRLFAGYVRRVLAARPAITRGSGRGFWG